jgi:hypothetical protein
LGGGCHFFLPGAADSGRSARNQLIT